MSEIKIAQIGLGPLGLKIAGYIKDRNGVATVAAVDKNPNLIGKDLGELAGLGANGVIVRESLGEALAETGVDVALLTTVSDMERITSQIEEIASAGIPVVSTCEELSFSWDTAPALSKRIDEVAKANDVAVLGTGINPGFLMDLLPTALTAVCQRVNSVRVSRIQDATFRRVPFQKKIGAGLTLEEFDAKKREGTLRHVGLTESVQMIAARMGWTLDRTEDVITPIVSESEVSSDAVKVKVGNAAGVQQVGKGFVNGEEKITLLFRAAIGEPDPRDQVEIAGEPDINSVIAGGVNGDVGTCAITINAVKQILRARPGLVTMTDVPPVSWFGA